MATDTTKKYSMEDLFADYGIDYADPEKAAKTAADTVLAKYASDKTDLANTTNQYYNNLYNTQNTVMDTIRQSNAQAVASGASKGVQAATTLSALLGLQNESVQGATELANESIKLAQDETAAILEAEQQAEANARTANTQNLSILPEIMNSETARQQFLAELELADPALASKYKNYFNVWFGTKDVATNISDKVQETTEELKNKGYADANATAVAQFYQGDWTEGNYDYDFFLKYDSKNNGGFSREGAIANGINNILGISNAQVTRVPKTDPKYQTYTYEIVIPKSSLSDAEYSSLKKDLGTAIKPNGSAYYTITMSANSGKYASWGTTLSEIGGALKKIRPNS